MDQLGLNELERKVVAFLKTNRRGSNQIYQDVFNVSKATATRHLDAIVKKGLINGSKSRSDPLVQEDETQIEQFSSLLQIQERYRSAIVHYVGWYLTQYMR